MSKAPEHPSGAAVRRVLDLGDRIRRLEAMLDEQRAVFEKSVADLKASRAELLDELRTLVVPDTQGGPEVCEQLGHDWDQTRRVGRAGQQHWYTACRRCDATLQVGL
jgi:hypothetical protein